MLQIRWLQTFVIAAKYENYRVAAEKLFLAQPTVTVHIQHLEDSLGCKLFKKNGRNITLTESGKHYLPYARSILDSYNKGFESLSSWQQGYERKLTIAVSPLIAASILSFVIKEFMKENPYIEVGIQVAESNEISSLVYEQKADLGISRMSAIHPGLDCTTLYDDPIIAVAAHDGGDSESSPPIELIDLLQKEVLLTHNHPLYWDDLLSSLRMIEPAVRTMVVTQVNVTKRFIEEGIGFSFLPHSSVKRELLEGRILEVHTDMLKLPVTHTYLIQKEMTEEIQQFIAFLNRYYFGA